MYMNLNWFLDLHFKGTVNYLNVFRYKRHVKGAVSERTTLVTRTL